jgi:death-on-curing protein
MSDIVWMTVNGVLALHEHAIRLFGGASGVRDAGLLEGALARPMNAHLYAGEDDIVALGGLYCAAIVRNHPFIDGNKRTGFVTCIAFLELNGLTFTAPQDKTADAVERLAAGTLDEAAFVGWIRGHVV